jgi:hypothetical protein
VLLVVALLSLVALPVLLRSKGLLAQQPSDQGSARKAASSDGRASSPPSCLKWPKPDVALFVTGRLEGYIEPCGCTGLANAKGGLSRRHAFLEQLRALGWCVIPIDAGEQVRRIGVQAEIKFQTTANVFRELDYRAIAFGAADLQLSIGELIAAVAGDGDAQGPFVCANVNLLDINSRFRVIEANGTRIGVTAILGSESCQKIESTDLELSDPAQAIKEVLPQLREADCHYLVLVSHASLDESRQLATMFPDFSLIITAGGAGEPTLEPERIEGTGARMIQVGIKGMYVGIVGLYRTGTPSLRYDRVELDARFPDSRKVLTAFALYQKQLQDLGLEGLGLRPVRHPSGRKFVGHEVCGACHTTAYGVFENTPHFHATRSIAQPTERSDIPRHHDPECLSCHVTGWEPQGFFPYASGYLDYDKSAALHSNGCENCHGPGAEHVAAENGELDVTEEQLEKLRVQMRITVEEAKRAKCYDCHDLDNSPDFDFERYWKEVEHHGKD